MGLGILNVWTDACKVLVGTPEVERPFGGLGVLVGGRTKIK